MCPPALMATLYTCETYHRACLYGWEPLSSTGYTALRSKDDGYILFQMFAGRYVAFPTA